MFGLEMMMPELIEPQLECLQQAIYHEARSESFKGQVMVGYVIKARMLDPRWEDTYCKVIEEPRQFSFIDEIGYAGMNEPRSRELAEQIAWMVITSPSPFPTCMLYYHGDYVEPNWDYSKIDVYDHEGSHIFYLDKGCNL